jgi:acetate CoA/acetoacetate CoA-transferase alpha subunit
VIIVCYKKEAKALLYDTKVAYYTGFGLFFFLTFFCIMKKTEKESDKGGKSMYRVGKLYSADDIIKEFKDGQTIMIGGQGVHGSPNHLIDLLLESGVRHLTTISLDAGKENCDIGKLVHNHVVDKMITAHAGKNKEVMKQHAEGKLEIEFCPMGTLAERIRCGGMGIGGFYVATGMGTGIEKGKPLMEIDGKTYMLETALHADLALVRCRAADPLGNLSYHGTSENVNPMMAINSSKTLVDPDIILEIDEIGIDRIKTPGVFVDMILS